MGFTILSKMRVLVLSNSDVSSWPACFPYARSNKRRKLLWKNSFKNRSFKDRSLDWPHRFGQKEKSSKTFFTIWPVGRLLPYTQTIIFNRGKSDVAFWSSERSKKIILRNFDKGWRVPVPANIEKRRHCEPPYFLWQTKCGDLFRLSNKSVEFLSLPLNSRWLIFLAKWVIW